MDRKSVGVEIAPEVRLILEGIPVPVNVIWGRAARSGQPPQLHLLNAKLLDAHGLELSLSGEDGETGYQARIRIGPKPATEGPPDDLLKRDRNRSEPVQSEPAGPQLVGPEPGRDINQSIPAGFPFGTWNSITVGTWNTSYWNGGSEGQIIGLQEGYEVGRSTRPIDRSFHVPPDISTRPVQREQRLKRMIDDVFYEQPKEPAPKPPEVLTVVLPPEFKQTDFAVRLDNCVDSEIADVLLEHLSLSEDGKFYGMHVEARESSKISVSSGAVLRGAWCWGDWPIDLESGGQVGMNADLQPRRLNVLFLGGDLGYVSILGAQNNHFVNQGELVTLPNEFEGSSAPKLWLDGNQDRRLPPPDRNGGMGFSR